MLLSQQKAVEVTYEKINNEYHFTAINHSNVPYYLKLQFAELNNLEANQSLEEYTPTIYPNEGETEILILRIVESDKGSGFNFNYLYTIGDPKIKVDKEFLYYLPYRHGERIRVGQGYNGSGTHRGINAIDFNLMVGDTIYAAREGFAYDIKEDSNKGGNNLSYEKDGNYIYIYQPDGTLGKYVHLKQNGALITTGDSIAIGQAIGLSGNTGYSSGPHLHFTVVHNKDFIPKTLSVSFLNYDQKGFIPQENKAYYAFHLGGPAFETKNEESFDETKLEKEKFTSSLSNKIEIESEAYGDYTLFYVNNGMSQAIKGKLLLELTNMNSTKRIPYEFEIEARSKKYLLAIIPKDDAEQFSYKLSAEFSK
ncbi:MAG: murein DD-endopeptidase MepM/ murein hydrolase activator NlpD [Marivirga sp.]|jgi:murein DD-endopeptidase MepM/ murein hydrolase activator NlpD